MAMSKRRKNEGSEGEAKLKVYGFRLDEPCDQKLREMAAVFGTTPSLCAKGILTKQLLANGTSPSPNGSAAPAAGTPSAQDLNELGTFLRQVRDELIEEAERQGKRLDALTARLN